MAGSNSGYDLSSSTYSPDGRLFQVEYAAKAVESAGTVIGLKLKDGVLFAVEKIVTSKLLVPGANKRIASVDTHIGLATAGLAADGRHLASRARDEANSYREQYRSPAPVKTISERLGLYCQAYTLYSSVRPFGISAILGGIDKAFGPSLFCIEPSGVFWGYRGCAVGKGRQLAKTEIEKLDLENMTCREAVDEAARILYVLHEEAKDKDFEIEMTWVCANDAEKPNVHRPVPKDLLAEAERKAKAAIEDAMED